MESIRDKVAVIGMGCTKFGERWDVGAADLVTEACFEALEDAGVVLDDIQAGGVPLTTTLKLRIPVTRVENACATATDAFRNASYAVAAGIYDMVMVCGLEKLKDTGVGGLGGGGAGVEPAQPPPSFLALMANRYFHDYGIPYEEGKRVLAKIAVKNHHNGTLAPKAHFHREISLEEAINAPMIAAPLGLYDCCGVSDGCAAAIITRPDIAKKYRNDYILVKGLGVCCGDGYAKIPSDSDFLHWEENLVAARLAYEEAGITNPREQIDVASVHDCFTINELITMEDLGFSPRGKGMDDVNAGFFELDGGLPVNTDGGLKCFGHPIGASGLRMIYEIYEQLQGKAGPRQVKNVLVLEISPYDSQLNNEKRLLDWILIETLT
jgi:acetyl-CoA C-acetyltransferase